MKRGELYRVYKGSSRDPKKYRVFVIVSRQVLIDSKFSTVICAPIYSRYDGLSTQVELGIEDGLKQTSGIHCDELISIPKSSLTNFVASLSPDKMMELNDALKVAVGLTNKIV
ncbi:type II toxin-antitoxin system PemK/MazF family toxin [candidate division KSB1 bacterium]|nr:type II toxin-antitoxin system PemK/MazF family toxin [candidate division KSB1 bacterium]NIR68638.1 type II toxin-antitoxin system PemK/MazF family toxin [candidate division KSB1 bacterium]NIS27127.1 type II toxin-antitoxin system PemK/MazF family toxin [candidate division KSB1 bacterium]NIT74013.1 type II toxin-antitoxin system PemK/MazF family toxin [candidate division KSB1 bacterium]NIU27879.1 type II toxin-antitoxin system PemK/MazF family toxin [candidate division KSB1 bacterium]